MNTPTIYSAAGSGVVKADQHGELVLLSDYLELKRQHDILDKKEEVQYRLRGALAEELKKAKAEIEELRGNPDPLTAYLYAAELCKDDIKTLKDEVRRLTLLQAQTLDERNKAEGEVERLRKNADIRHSQSPDEVARLKAEIERLDNLVRYWSEKYQNENARFLRASERIAAKKGKPTK